MKYVRIGKIAFRLLLLNPKLFAERIIRELRAKLHKPQGLVKGSVYGLKFDFDFSKAKSIKAMYFDLYEMGVIHTMETFLKKGDIFIDAGANIGYMSAVAAGLVGKTGQVHSFEPVPVYAECVRKLAADNSEYNIKVNEIALGETEGIMPLSIVTTSIGHSTFVAAAMRKENIEKTIDVAVARLDKYIQAENLHKVKMVKVDVEGFEFPVIRGMQGLFDNGCFPLIVCEIFPYGFEVMGSSVQKFLEYMASYSYAPFKVIAPNKRLSLSDIESERTSNVLFRHV